MLALLLSLFTTRVIDPDALVRNPRACSPDGRYCVIVREYSNLPDFASAPLKVLVRDIHPTERRAALYAEKRRIATTVIPRAHSAIHVASSGKFVVVRETKRPVVASTPLLDIFTRGELHTLKAGDLFASTDFDAINRLPLELDVRIDGSELIVAKEIRISLATARRLEPLRDRYPSARTWVTVSKQLLARVVDRPLPVYPPVAVRANISGSTLIEVTVSEEGRVLASRVLRPMPFGIDAAAMEAARKWTFKPQQAEWQGMLEFHFGWISEEECRRVQCDGLR